MIKQIIMVPLLDENSQKSNLLDLFSDIRSSKLPSNISTIQIMLRLFWWETELWKYQPWLLTGRAGQGGAGTVWEGWVPSNSVGGGGSIQQCGWGWFHQILCIVAGSIHSNSRLGGFESTHRWTALWSWVGIWSLSGRGLLSHISIGGGVGCIEQAYKPNQIIIL